MPCYPESYTSENLPYTAVFKSNNIYNMFSLFFFPLVQRTWGLSCTTRTEFKYEKFRLCIIIRQEGLGDMLVGLA